MTEYQMKELYKTCTLYSEQSALSILQKEGWSRTQALAIIASAKVNDNKKLFWSEAERLNFQGEEDDLPF